MRRIAIVGLGILGLLVSACDDEVLIRLPEPEVHIDELRQRPAALIDILWVVDNSGSMVEEQESLAFNFNQFISGLTICQGTNAANDVCDFNTKKCTVSGGPCNPPDYHIGVITSDVNDLGRLRKIGVCVPTAGATPSGNKYRYCGGLNADCAHDANDPNSDPANSNCDLNNPAALTYVNPTTPNGVNAFARAVRVGVGGSGLEQGIRAAAMAVGRDTERSTGQWIPAPAENAGFLRQNASLFVIFVSDEEDGSFGQTTYFYRAFESLKSAGNEALVSVSSIVGNPDFDGPMGTDPGGCIPAPNEDPAAPGYRYVSLSMYSRSLSAELRVCDERRLTCTADQACKKPIAELPGVCLPTAACTIDQDCGNFKCGDGNGCSRCESGQCTLSGDRFLELLGQTGIYGSICSPAYDVVLGKLGFEAAGLSRKFLLTKNPDCTKAVPCCNDGVSEEMCTMTAPVCVKVAGEVIPNDRASGWVYEPSSNAIFFDGTFVPPTDATINVYYRLSQANTQLSCTTALQ